MAPPTLVIMFASKLKLRIALSLFFWTNLVVGQNATVEGVSDRTENQLDLAGSATAKSFEPPPEFYRGPGSGSSSSSGSSSHPSLGSVGESLSETYNNWRAGSGNFQDRISVGHYGAAGGVASGVASHSPTVGSFESNSHPYPYEYSHASGGGANLGGGGAYFGSSSVEAGIPFDVYGSRPGHGVGHGHYSPPEYAYPYPLDPHEIAAHKGPGHGELSSKALLAKSFLIPLASAAVLGIAAALVSNPLLLQLGTVSGLGTIVGKRKRRATTRNLLSKKAHKYTI
ncbi:uncharacterized protein LOC108100994 [Drosophila ficusphila]|uniref:uncharacterized protein LOC108100994 n=1 Tax=Drosophila ficusphila TaxID=30025 RepID=UPI0007E7A16C|nr:uncharacterized protein LOC108100994 [Drosophila ficusphila]